VPVHKVAGGWRWGQHGKVYSTKAGAERQARAIYASGYRDAIKDARSDEDVRVAREDWAKARRAEIQYGASLRKIARHIADLIRGSAPRSEADASALERALTRYAEILDPWAHKRAEAMIAEIRARSDKQWRKVAAEMGRGFREILTGPDAIGQRQRELMAEQITLIKSIPIEAAERVHHLVQQSVIKGERFTSIVPEIMRGGEVSKSKATLIARTETGRALTALTQARAETVGSEGYIWRTVKDADVRPSHRAMEGKFVRWDDPPTTDGMTYHAGAGPNCRCFAEPVIPMPGEPERPRFMAEAA